MFSVQVTFPQYKWVTLTQECKPEGRNIIDPRLSYFNWWASLTLNKKCINNNMMEKVEFISKYLF